MEREYEETELDKAEEDLYNILKKKLDNYEETIGSLLEELNELKKETTLLLKENERLKNSIKLVKLYGGIHQ